MFWTKAATLCQCIRGGLFFDLRCPACYHPFTPSPTSCPVPGSVPGSVPQLCPQCAAQLKPRPRHVCPLCGRPQEGLGSAASASPCLACLASPPPWKALTFFAPYTGLMQNLLLRYKFGQESSLTPLLSFWLQQCCAALPPCTLLVPMPRHVSRLRDRGFNQVLELARPVAKGLGMAMPANTLLRRRFTQPQTGLSAKARKDNPKNSFEAKGVQGERVLLVDDIMTTGSTLQHAVLTLLEAGANSVYTAVLARGHGKNEGGEAQHAQME